MQRPLSVAAMSVTALLAATGASSCLWLFPYNIDNLCETNIRAQCHFAHQCCNASERNLAGTAFSQYRNEDDCVRESIIESCGFFEVVIESQRAGRFDFDEELVQGCFQPRIDALNSCDAKAVFDPEEDPDCEGVGLTSGAGKVADGDLCFEDFECSTTGAVCKPNEPGDDEVLVSAKGECEAPPKEGEDCPAFICASGLYCDTTAAPVCAAMKPEGADCDGNNECVSGNCQFDFAGTQTCEPKKDNGEDCLFDSECKSEFCDGNTSQCAGAVDDGRDVVVDACDGLGKDEE